MKSKNIIIIYNPASIDSTVAAAYLKTNLKNKLLEDPEDPDIEKNINNKIKCYVAGNKVPIGSDNIYYWVGVEPKKETLDFFLNNTGNKINLISYFYKRDKFLKKTIPHIGYFSNPIDKKVDVYFTDSISNITSIANTPTYNSDDNLQFFNGFSITPSILSSVCVDHPIEKGPSWNIIYNIVNFHNKNLKLSLEEQATIYKNFNNALTTLCSNKDFKFELATEADYENYSIFLKRIKEILQLANVSEYSKFKIDKEIISIPVINVNLIFSPWILKFLNFNNDYCVTYEQRNSRTIFSCLGLYAGFDKVLLNEMKANKINCRLSNQL